MNNYLYMKHFVKSSSLLFKARQPVVSSLLTFDRLFLLFCTMAKSGISMQVSTVSSQDRCSITASMRQVFIVLRASALAFSATVRPTFCTSECRREERLPGRDRDADVSWQTNLYRAVYSHYTVMGVLGNTFVVLSCTLEIVFKKNVPFCLVRCCLKPSHTYLSENRDHSS